MTAKSVMLAPNELIALDDPRIPYPMLASVKFDGFRCLCIEGELFTRKLKPQKNLNLYTHLAGMIDYCRHNKMVMDMELYDHELPDFAAHQSILASHDAPIPPTLKAHVFDCIEMGQWRGDYIHHPFAKHVEFYAGLIASQSLTFENCTAVDQVPVTSPDAARLAFQVALEEGHEGIMLRSFGGHYKHGRATLNEGLIYKVKDFHTDDGVIVDVIQGRKMTSEAKAGERTYTADGKMERLHTKDSYEPDDIVGCFQVKMEDGTVSEVNYGRGFPHAVRREHWRDRLSLIGKAVEVRHQPHGASVGIRIGQLVRFRPDKD